MGLPDVSPSTVLVADDDSLVRMSLRFALESRGLRVVEVDDSVQLISNVVIERPVLCIIDVNMPGPSVVDRISAIREVSPSTAVLVISGEVIAPAALVSLGVPYLHKPIELVTLLGAVNEAISHRSVAVGS